MTVNCIIFCYNVHLFWSFAPWDDFLPLQHIYVELKLLLKQPSHLLQNNKVLSLRVMASSYMFQRAVYQQRSQKHSWMCESVCLASFRFLQTVNLLVQSIGCLVPTSLQSLLMSKYSTVLHYLLTNSVNNSCLSIQSVHRRNFHTHSQN